jgi:hypothetical protein
VFLQGLKLIGTFFILFFSFLPGERHGYDFFFDIDIPYTRGGLKNYVKSIQANIRLHHLYSQDAYCFPPRKPENTLLGILDYKHKCDLFKRPV